MNCLTRHAKLVLVPAWACLFLLARPPAAWPQKKAGLRPSPVVAAEALSDREQDGLVGPVRRVRTETAKIVFKSDRPAEQPRELLEVTAYDRRGGRLENAYYLVSQTSTADKEEYEYDESGNLTGRALRDASGALLSREVYAYEFDEVGNWTKRITSVVVVESGKVGYEPDEVTYRTITYYPGTAIAKTAKLIPRGKPRAATEGVGLTRAEGEPSAASESATASAAEKTGPVTANPRQTGEPAQVAALTTGMPTVTSEAAAPCSAGAEATLLVVAGAVKSPSTHAVSDGLNLRDGLLLAGGADARAGRSVFVIRGVGGCARDADGVGPTVVEMYERTIAEEGKVGLDRPLRGGDTVFVPETDVAFVTGAVAHPGLIKVQGRTTLTAAVRSLGGTLNGARRDSVRVSRPLPNGASLQQFIINLSDIEGGRIGDVALWPGDIVEVVSSHGSNKDQSLAAVVKRAATETQKLVNAGTP